MTRADELLDAFQAAWTARNAWRFSELCAPDLHYEDPFVTEPLVGPGRLGAHAERLWTAFPDVRVERAGERVAQGARLVAPVKVLGTNSGELDGLPPTRRFVVVPALLWVELDAAQERLWRARVFCDRYEAAVQLGLLPKPGSMGEKALLALRGFGLSPRR